MGKTLLIRADASVVMGTGHIMRMIALAQAWREEGEEVVFLCAEITPALEERVRTEGFSFEKLAVVPGGKEDLEATCSMISRLGGKKSAVVVALDGYNFGSDFQRDLKHKGCRLLLVDDYGHADFYNADLVLNQNISAREDLYSKRAPGTHLMLGPKFALLRSEFVHNNSRSRTTPKQAATLLVTLGGADPDNATEKVIDALLGSGLEVKVVVGGSNPHLPSLRRAAAAAAIGSTRVELVVNTLRMPELMKWADMAVAAGGSTSWELAFFGVPTLFMILADNQAANARELERQGFGVCLGENSKLTASQVTKAILRLARAESIRSEFSIRGQKMVDGGGAARVANAMMRSPLSVRLAVWSDAQLLWRWANDPVVRKFAFDSAPIPWQTHAIWFRKILKDKNSVVFIGTNCLGEAVGQARFQGDGDEAAVDISVAKKFRGKGYAKEILSLSLTHLFQEGAWRRAKAWVVAENFASRKTFENIGFKLVAQKQEYGRLACEYCINREDVV
jgi:UDP-2,4-diacetamido-2,4,6-trideoxy-beta-L-altropyranose hydrolase